MRIVHSKIASTWMLLILFIISSAACSEAGFNPLKLMNKKRAAKRKAASEESAKTEIEKRKLEKLVDLESNDRMRVEKDVIFATRNKQDMALDIAVPKGNRNKKYPAIIYVHGGGFVAGDRLGFYRHLKESVERGYVAATVDYRLADGNPAKKFPAAVNDVAAAVRWLKKNADAYQIDPDRIGIYGGSAGGNLALMVGLASELVDENPNRLYPEQNSRVKAIVNFCGPTDYAILLDSKNKKADPMHVAAYLKGKKIKDLRASAKKASPVYYVGKDDPPVLTVHGTKDSIVPFDSAIRLDEEIKRIGGSHELVRLEGGDHPGLSKIDFRETLRNASFAFFDEKL